MNPRDWLIVAFMLTAVMGLTAIWVVDMQQRRINAGAQSIEGVKVALTPYERDRREAMEKLDRIYGGGK